MAAKSFVFFLAMFCYLIFGADAKNLTLRRDFVDALFPAMSYGSPRVTTSGDDQFNMVEQNRPWSGKTPVTEETDLDHLAIDLLPRPSTKNRTSTNCATNGSEILPSKSSYAELGLNMGASKYAITIALGTPPITQTVLLDTSSDISWIQCNPCKWTCYPQREPLFDPTLSSTHRNVTCDSCTCLLIPNARCYNDSICLYGVTYGDKSSCHGFLASDTLRISRDVLDNFTFICGQLNQGLLNQFSGVFSLGQSKHSLNSQWASKKGNIFSYCLPSKCVAVGYLDLGKPRISPSGYTPMITNQWGPSLYFVNLTGITVGEKKIMMSLLVSQSQGTILDSGTEITRLPPITYNSLRTTFRAAMMNYPLVAPFEVMDTCYDMSGNKTVTYPGITFHFEGLDIMLPKSGILYFVNSSQVCLGFAGNSNNGQSAIIGSVQQRTMQVTFDNERKRIGFAYNACQ